MAVPARGVRLAGDGIDGDGGHGRVLSPAEKTRGRRADLRPRRRDRRSDLLGGVALPDRRVPRRDADARAAREGRGDGRTVQDAGGRPPGDHRHARSRAAGADGPDRGPRPHQLSRLRQRRRAGDRPQRHSAGPAPAGGDRLLRVPHHGRPRDDVHRDHERGALLPLAPHPLRAPLDALDPDARRAVPLHRQRGRMGGRRGRPSAVDGLRAAARRRRLVAQRDGRHDVLHADRLHGVVSRARPALSPLFARIVHQGPVDSLAQGRPE